MPKPAARLLPVESAKHIIYEKCKKRTAARHLLAGSFAVTRAVSNLIRRKMLLPSGKVVSIKNQTSVRLDINNLLANMKELASLSIVNNKDTGALQLPNQRAVHSLQSASVLKLSRFSRYVKAKVQDLHMQRCSSVLSAMSGVNSRNISLMHKIVTRRDSELMKRDVDTFRQTFDKLESTTWMSASNIQQNSYGDDVLQLTKQTEFLLMYLMVFLCLDENDEIQSTSELCL